MKPIERIMFASVVLFVICLGVSTWRNLPHVRFARHVAEADNVKSEIPRLRGEVVRYHAFHLRLESELARGEGRYQGHRLLNDVRGAERKYRRDYQEVVRRYNRLMGPAAMLVGNDPIVKDLFKDPSDIGIPDHLVGTP